MVKMNKQKEPFRLGEEYTSRGWSVQEPEEGEEGFILLRDGQKYIQFFGADASKEINSYLWQLRQKPNLGRG